jgi:hypothetical protein
MNLASSVHRTLPEVSLSAMCVIAIWIMSVEGCLPEHRNTSQLVVQIQLFVMKLVQSQLLCDITYALIPWLLLYTYSPWVTFFQCAVDVTWRPCSELRNTLAPFIIRLKSTWIMQHTFPCSITSFTNCSSKHTLWLMKISDFFKFLELTAGNSEYFWNTSKLPTGNILWVNKHSVARNSIASLLNGYLFLAPALILITVCCQSSKLLLSEQLP